MLSEDIAKIMQMIPQEEVKQRHEGTDKVVGGAFSEVMSKATPFMYKGGEGINAGVGETEWVVAKDQVYKFKNQLFTKYYFHYINYTFHLEINVNYLKLKQYYFRLSMTQYLIV